jgi:hypothetical protein
MCDMQGHQKCLRVCGPTMSHEWKQVHVLYMLLRTCWFLTSNAASTLPSARTVSDLHPSPHSCLPKSIQCLQPSQQPSNWLDMSSQFCSRCGCLRLRNTHAGAVSVLSELDTEHPLATRQPSWEGLFNSTAMAIPIRSRPYQQPAQQLLFV